MIKAGKSIFIGGTIYISINFVLGVLYGYFAGFSPVEMLIVAGITTISSSAIVRFVISSARSSFLVLD